jgi:shikimate kinase
MHVVFIGASGSGKTHWGRELARLTGRPFADLDALVEATLACSIPELFASGREAEFRDVESALLAEVLSAEVPGVLSTGGGTPMRPESFGRLQDSGAHIVALRPPLEKLVQRLETVWAHRPLLSAEGPNGWRSKVEDLFHERASTYAELANETWTGKEEEACLDLAKRLNSSQSR